MIGNPTETSTRDLIKGNKTPSADFSWLEIASKNPNLLAERLFCDLFPQGFWKHRAGAHSSAGHTAVMGDTRQEDSRATFSSPQSTTFLYTWAQPPALTVTGRVPKDLCSIKKGNNKLSYLILFLPSWFKSKLWFSKQDMAKGPEVQAQWFTQCLYTSKYRSEHHLPFENSLPLLRLTKNNSKMQPLHLANQPQHLEFSWNKVM